jgi:long-chain acyl-CoA synthetase
MLFATSGTTGEEKIVAHSSKSLLAGLNATLAVQEEVSHFRIERPHGGGQLPQTASNWSLRAKAARLGLRMFAPMSLSTIAGFTVMQRALLVGEALIVPKGRTAEDMLDAMTRYSATNVSLTPFMAQTILRRLRATPQSLPSLLMIGVGGSMASPRLLSQLEDFLCTPVLSGYGSTELGGPVLMSRISDEKEIRTGTVGRELPGVLCRTDVSSNYSEKSRYTGELVVKSPSLALGYFNGPKGLKPFDNGEYRTGDLCYQRPDGNYCIVGRTSDTIMRSGRRVDPEKIEEILEQHEAVVRAGVVGMPSRVLDEEDIVAFVLAGEGRDIRVTDLIQWCTSRLPRFAVPRRIHLVSAMPLSRDGAIQRDILRTSEPAHLR